MFINESFVHELLFQYQTNTKNRLSSKWYLVCLASRQLSNLLSDGTYGDYLTHLKTLIRITFTRLVLTILSPVDFAELSIIEKEF